MLWGMGGKRSRKTPRWGRVGGALALLFSVILALVTVPDHPTVVRIVALTAATVFGFGCLAVIFWEAGRWIMGKVSSDDDDSQGPSTPGPGPFHGPVGSQGQTGGHTTQINYPAGQPRRSVGIAIHGSRDVKLYDNTVTGFDTGVEVVDSSVEARNNLISGPPSAPNRAARRALRRSKRGRSPQPPSRESADRD